MSGSEADREETEHGLVCKGDGWFLVNARDVRWYRTGEARITNFGGDTRFEQLGVSIEVLEAWQQLNGAIKAGMDLRRYELATLAAAQRLRSSYCCLMHGRVLRGSGTLVVEGEERPLREWDYFHCPPGVAHVIVGGPIVVAAFGARQDDRTEYVADPVAAAHGAAPAQTTTDPRVAYEGWERPTHTRYDGWLD